jgi:alkanesulfonate monooxygenase SsuD/methylene tetrahydromethanopterin reductase-like flavin-dependent oxidoreductase (luciferase family)
MALAIIGGLPERFAQFVGLYRESARRAGRDPRTLRLGINSHGMIADTTQDAAETFYPAYASMMNAIGRERGWPPLGRADFDASRELRGANFVGSPQEVIDKILFQHEIFSHDRFLLQMSVGTLPHAKVMRSIELLGTVVAPAVRKAIG